MSTSNDPLWTMLGLPRLAVAAVLRVIADEVVPEEQVGRADCYETARQGARQCIRQRLLAEAEQAEAGR